MSGCSHDNQKISLWGMSIIPGNEANEDLSEVVGEAVESVGDTIVYNTADLVIDLQWTDGQSDTNTNE